MVNHRDIAENAEDEESLARCHYVIGDRPDVR